MTSSAPSSPIRIGGASGYWGESDMAWGQLLTPAADGTTLDFLVFDYLAEITMSLMARMRDRDPAAGFAPDFVAGIEKHGAAIAAQGVRVIANAGGINPEGCAAAVRAALAKAGVDLKVAVVTGDDLMDRLNLFEGAMDMFSGEPVPPSGDILSANAYLGAFPIAAALDAGADIVITGRCVDSAVTLSALIHHFGWAADDLDRLAQGSLVGHLIECGPQVTGGNFTDWADIADSLTDIGYPIAEVQSDGRAVITKPAETGGIVNRGTVAEQMLYEIGDPGAYILPDVICDFTGVEIEQIATNRVQVCGARGRGVPDHYKTSITVRDGYRISLMLFMVGGDAAAKARVFSDAALSRTRVKLGAMNAPEFTETALEMIGDESHFGDHTHPSRPREVAFRLSARHPDARACALLLKEASGFALASPPGFFMFTGGRPKPQSVARLISVLTPKDAVNIRVDGKAFDVAPAIQLDPVAPHSPPAPTRPADAMAPLRQLAWLRSGDKGDQANIGVAARTPELFPYIWAAVTEDAVRERFAHFVDGDISRWALPGSDSLNILMDRALGGGGMASLRLDAQGKSFGQILAAMPIPLPSDLLPK